MSKDGYEAQDYYKNTAVAAEYASQYHEGLTARNWRAQFIGRMEERAFLQLLGKVETDTRSVLDIASGTGRYLELLIKAGFESGGLDISNEMLEHARGRLADFPNLSFLKQGDAAGLPFPENSFDLVTCIRLYHRVPADIRLNMLKEVKRVGRGQAILFFGMSSPWLRFRNVVRNRLIINRASNPYPVTVGALKNELKLAGMQIKDSRKVIPILAGGIVTLVNWKISP